jgi:L,D-transpeptidase YbiS
MKSLAPWGLYVVIDTAANRLYLVRDQKVQKEVVVSCGSGDVLEERGGSRKWIFDTPRGEFSVTSKLVNPTWIKPDWAFIEEGEKPPANFNDRVDNDSLGAYALGFGDGYFIHGTLYTRLLGRNVTHGCVRVGDKDLKSVFETVPLGTKVYIY